MALADIISRIASDAAAECELELSAAAVRADALLAAARAEAEAHQSRTIEAARRDAASQAATLVATTRLGARDEALTAKRELVTTTLGGVTEALEALPGDRYARFIAAGIADAVRDGDTVALAADDAGHVAAIRAAVQERAPGVSVEWEEDPAPVSRGAIITGPRTHVEVTPASVVASRRDELEVKVATRLFSREGR